MACSTGEIRKLLMKGNNFTWSQAREEEFQAIKKLVTSSLVVKQYDINKKPVLFTDGSKLFGAAYSLCQESGEAT